MDEYTRQLKKMVEELVSLAEEYLAYRVDHEETWGEDSETSSALQAIETQIEQARSLLKI